MALEVSCSVGFSEEPMPRLLFPMAPLAPSANWFAVSTKLDDKELDAVSLVDPSVQSVWTGKIGWSRSPRRLDLESTPGHATPEKESPYQGDPTKEKYSRRDGLCQLAPARSVLEDYPHTASPLGQTIRKSHVRWPTCRDFRDALIRLRKSGSVPRRIGAIRSSFR